MGKLSVSNPRPSTLPRSHHNHTPMETFLSFIFYFSVLIGRNVTDFGNKFFWEQNRSSMFSYSYSGVGWFYHHAHIAQLVRMCKVMYIKYKIIKYCLKNLVVPYSSCASFAQKKKKTVRILKILFFTNYIKLTLKVNNNYLKILGLLSHVHT